MSRLRVWFAFLLLSLIWGASYLFIRIGDEQLTPVALVALRLFVGAVVIGILAVVLHADLHISRRALLIMVALSAVNTTIPFLLITWGEKTITSGMAAVLNSTTPIFSLLVAHALLRDEPITLPRVAGVIVGFAGVVILFSGDLSQGTVDWWVVGAQGAVVLAAVCYAFGAVLARRTLHGLHSMTIATYTLWFAAMQSIVLSLIFSRPPTGSLHPSTLFAVVWLGALGSALAYLLYYFIIMAWGASRATLVTYVVPAIGLGLGAVFLQEIVDWRILAGSALIIAGVVLASLVRGPALKERQETPATTGRSASAR